MTLLITNTRLVDPEAAEVKPGAILVRNGIIAEVFDTPTPEISTDHIPDENRRDAGGKYLAPGIVDIGVKILRTRRAAQRELWVCRSCGGSGGCDHHRDPPRYKPIYRHA